MTETLYDILDVPPDADTAAVKRAYRRKAAQTHPDKGGSPEAFSAVAGAWLVLRDPERRSRYDATGETDAPVNDRMARISQMLCAIFDQLIMRSDVDHIDLIGEVKRNLREVKKKSLANSAEVKKQVKKIESARRRLSYKGKAGDYLVNMCNDKLFAARKMLADLEKEQDACDGALLYAEDYLYEADKREPEPWGTTPSRMGMWRNTSP